MGAALAVVAGCLLPFLAGDFFPYDWFSGRYYSDSS
jgi:hypothetical protein